MQKNIPLKDQASALPLVPGVYQFVDATGTVLYVGKAKALRKRVLQYFIEARLPSKIRVMVRRAVEIRHIVTDSETDALLLENSLIKRLQPRFNAMLKDDKTYPWIVVRKEPFPRIRSTRQIARDGSAYFGPYASIGVQKNLLEILHAVFLFRTCSLNLAPEEIAKGRYRPCLKYHLGNCKAPCAGLQTPEEYAENVEMARSMLRGELGPIRRALTAAMRLAASELRFEEAAALKHRLDLLENYSARSVIVSPSLGDLDVFALIVDDDTAYCNFVRIARGNVVNSFSVALSLGAEQDPRAILTAAILQIGEIVGGGADSGGRPTPVEACADTGARVQPSTGGGVGLRIASDSEQSTETDLSSKHDRFSPPLPPPGGGEEVSKKPQNTTSETGARENLSLAEARTPQLPQAEECENTDQNRFASANLAPAKGGERAQNNLSTPLNREIIVPFLPEVELFPGHRFTVPKRGEKQKLLEFAEKNARMFRAEQLKNLEIRDPEKATDRVMAAMQRELHLPREPRHIECFDNSNLQGTHPVASCVVFRDGRPARKEYRHFNVKTVVGPDDFASMREIVRRRYTRLLEEERALNGDLCVGGGGPKLAEDENVNIISCEARSARPARKLRSESRPRRAENSLRELRAAEPGAGTKDNLFVSPPAPPLGGDTRISPKSENNSADGVLSETPDCGQNGGQATLGTAAARARTEAYVTAAADGLAAASPPLSPQSILPDLVVVDGGKGQLSAAYSVFLELGIADRVPLVGLAKRIEEVFFPADPMPYYLSRNGEPLRVMMHIRDEAHRFGITFHRNKRSADFIRSELENIPGIGPASVSALLRAFRTVDAIKKAGPPELASVVGTARAEAIRKYFA